MITVIIIAIFVTAAYFYSIKTFGYWKKKGIKHDIPVPFLGTNLKGYFLQRSKTQLAIDMYWKYPDERIVGFYRSSAPELIIRDPDIVKRILLTDFNYFHHRGMYSSHDDVSELLVRHIFSVDGDLWRFLRQRLTPAFTGSKLKTMFPVLVKRTDRLYSRIQAADGAPIDARDLMARFATDFIGACGFGIEMDALSDDNSEFRKLGAKIFDITPVDAFKTLLKEVFPNTFKKIKITEKFEKDIISLVQSILRQRNRVPSGINDFIDFLLECKVKGPLVAESVEKCKPDGTPKKVLLEMTDDLIVAQAFVFFAAGFEASSSTTSFTLHLLAYYPRVQRKIQEEIDRVHAKYDNQFNYDALKEMTYLEWTLKESMRIFPAVGYLVRQCASTYKFPDMDLIIDKGVKIMIPIQAMQNDPKYFENPDEFRPERFDPKELDIEKTKYTYLPFGDGLRSCIGARLGLMQSMTGLWVVLSKFTVEPGITSVRYPHVDTTPGIVQTIQGGLPLVFRERKKNLG